MRVQQAQATVIDQCNQEFTFTVDEDSDSNFTTGESGGRVSVVFSSSPSGNDPENDADEPGTQNTQWRAVTVTAAAGYQIVSVEADHENDSGSTLGGTVWVTVSPTTSPVSYDPAGEGIRIDKIKVVVKKLCTEVCGDIAATNYSAPVSGQTYANNALCTYPEVPVDVCTNIIGNQASVPQGYTEVGGICTEVIVTPPATTTPTTTPPTEEPDEPETSGGGGSSTVGVPSGGGGVVYCDPPTRINFCAPRPNTPTGGTGTTPATVDFPLNTLPYTGYEVSNPFTLKNILISALVALMGAVGISQARNRRKV